MAHKDEESLIEWELFLFKCAAQGLSDRKPLDKNRHWIEISAEYIKSIPTFGAVLFSLLEI